MAAGRYGSVLVVLVGASVHRSIAVRSTIIPTGAIILYTAAAIPSGFLKCDGSTVSQTTYSALYALIGHSYGADPGGGNFILPNLNSKFPIGSDGTHALASAGGSFTSDGSSSGGNPRNGGGTSFAQQSATHTFKPPYLALNYIIKI